MITYRGDQLAIVPLETPDVPVLTRRGTAGDVTYTYKVVAVKAGAHTDASEAASVTDGPTTLSNVNAIDVKPPYVQGAVSYDIYRTAGGSSQGKIGSLTANNSGTTQRASFRDRGQAGDSADAPTTNTTGQLLLGESVLDAQTVIVKRARAILTDAQIKALPTTAVTLIAAPASGNVIVPLSAVLQKNFAAGPYTNVDASASLVLGWGGQTAVNKSYASLQDSEVGFFTGDSDELYPLALGLANDGSGGAYPPGTDQSAFDGQGLTVKAVNGSAGAFTGGHADNTLVCTLYYVELDLA